MKISAAIIVRNEEDNVAALCESISFVDEIVIVDSDSTDRTVEIARKYTDRVFNREFLGYKDKHQFADAQTTGDWILWIDADERVTPQLRASIEALRQQPDASLADGYRIARRTEYLGRWIRFAGWYPDYQMRLYRKSVSYWDGVSPHETARVPGRIDILPGEFLHYTKRDLSDYQHVMDRYTTLAAEYLHKKGRRVRGIDLVVIMLASFISTYILKQGFRDGVPGLILSISTAYSVFLKYAKVWEMTHVISRTPPGDAE